MDNLPKDIKYKILSFFPPEKLVSLALSNEEWWNIHREMRSRPHKWDPNVEWIDSVIPVDHLYIPNTMMVGSISDLLEEPVWFSADGVYKFSNYENGGVWLRKPEQKVKSLTLLQVATNENSDILRGFGNQSGEIIDDGSPNSKNIKRILRDADKLLKQEPDGDTDDGVILNNNHSYPLFFYLTDLPANAHIYIEDPVDRGDQIIWDAISGETGNSVGRVVGFKTTPNEMAIPYQVGLGFLSYPNSYRIAGLGNWRRDEDDMEFGDESLF